MPKRVASLLDAIPIVQSTADRAALFPTPDIDQRVHNKQTAAIERWTGSAWVTDFGGAAPPGGQLIRMLEFRAMPENGAFNDGDPISSIFGWGRGNSPAPLTGAAPWGYLQGNSPDPLTFKKVDGRPCFQIAVTLNNHHTSPVFRPFGFGRFALDFQSTFHGTTGTIIPGVTSPLATIHSCWFRKINSGDGSSARLGFGFADNTIVYSSRPVSRIGLHGDGVGGYRYGSLNCPDGGAAGANGDTDIDAGGDGFIQPADLVAPGANWWRTDIKIVPATPTTNAMWGAYHNGTLLKTWTNVNNFPRGTQQSSVADFTRIEATLRAFDLIPGLYMFDWRVIITEDLSL